MRSVLHSGRVGEALTVTGRALDGLDADHDFFGPTNVAIHQVSAAAELGDATEVIRLGHEVDTSGLPLDACGRRAQVHLDVARGYEAKHQDERPCTVCSTPSGWRRS